MNITISGSRDFKRLELVDKWLCENFTGDDTLIIGGAEGVDQRAEEYAKRCLLKYKIYKPEWDIFGRAAGPIRNNDMVVDSEKVICFWNGVSKGTKSTIESALRHKKDLEVIFDK